MRKIISAGGAEIDVIQADAYNGPDETRGVNVNSCATFIGCGIDRWYVIESKSAIKAIKQIENCSTWEQVKETLRAVKHE